MLNGIWLALLALATLAIIYWLYSRNRFVKIRTARPAIYNDVQARYERSHDSRVLRRQTSSLPRKLEGSWITVKYRNYCLKCSALIEEGEKALWMEGMGIWHGNCRKSLERKASKSSSS